MCRESVKSKSFMHILFNGYQWISSMLGSRFGILYFQCFESACVFCFWVSLGLQSSCQCHWPACSRQGNLKIFCGTKKAALCQRIPISRLSCALISLLSSSSSILLVVFQIQQRLFAFNYCITRTIVSRLLHGRALIDTG